MDGWQVFYSVLDQQMFGAEFTSLRSSEVLQQVQQQFGILPSVPGDATHARFGHLVTYGAGYYSYLWAQALACEVWHKVRLVALGALCNTPIVLTSCVW